MYYTELFTGPHSIYCHTRNCAASPLDECVTFQNFHYSTIVKYFNRQYCTVLFCSVLHYNEIYRNVPHRILECSIVYYRTV